MEINHWIQSNKNHFLQKEEIEIIVSYFWFDWDAKDIKLRFFAWEIFDAIGSCKEKGCATSTK